MNHLVSWLTAGAALLAVLASVFSAIISSRTSRTVAVMSASSAVEVANYTAQRDHEQWLRAERLQAYNAFFRSLSPLQYRGYTSDDQLQLTDLPEEMKGLLDAISPLAVLGSDRVAVMGQAFLQKFMEMGDAEGFAQASLRVFHLADPLVNPMCEALGLQPINDEAGTADLFSEDRFQFSPLQTRLDRLSEQGDLVSRGWWGDHEAEEPDPVPRAEADNPSS